MLPPIKPPAPPKIKLKVIKETTVIEQSTKLASLNPLPPKLTKQNLPDIIAEREKLLSALQEQCDLMLIDYNKITQCIFGLTNEIKNLNKLLKKLRIKQSSSSPNAGFNYIDDEED